MNVAVIGPGADASEDDLRNAERIGMLLAREGWTVLTGGLDGVMEAACAGAVREGGLAIGLLPGDDVAAANPSASVALPTGLGELRNGLLVRAAAGLICIGGSWGTMSEVAFAIRIGKPLVQLGGWHVINHKGERQPGPIDVSTPEDALAALKKILKG
jgi:uncharacterized protein (TIGR00725 family)